MEVIWTGAKNERVGNLLGKMNSELYDSSVD